jgi:hypothetical protein
MPDRGPKLFRCNSEQPASIEGASGQSGIPTPCLWQVGRDQVSFESNRLLRTLTFKCLGNLALCTGVTGNQAGS